MCIRDRGIQRLRAVTDDAADVVRRRQVTAEGDADNFGREVTGDAAAAATGRCDVGGCHGR